MLSDPVAEAFGLIHRHPSGENLWYGVKVGGRIGLGRGRSRKWKVEVEKGR